MRSLPWQRIALLALLIVTTISLLPGNSESRRLNYHEILVAQTATEMLENSEFLVPSLMGEPRLKKPPLSYWLSIIAHKVLDRSSRSRISEFEARLPSLVSGLLLILVTYGLGRLATGKPQGGLIAASFLVTSVSFFIYTRNARPEMIYALLCALMTLGLLLAIRRAEQGRPTTAAAIVAWSAFSISFLAKGPQFPLFILLGFVLGMVFLRPRLPLLATLHPWMALPALVLPLAYFAYLGFHVDNAFALWGNEMAQGDHIPLWKRPLRFYYPVILFVGLAPWLIVFATTLKDIWKRREHTILILACCVLVSVCLVSFAGKLRPHYLLPVMPICATLMAWSILNAGKSLRANTPQPLLFKILAWSQFALVGVVLIALLVTFVVNEGGTNKLDLVYAAIPWLVVSGALYVSAAIAASRSTTVTAVVLVASILCSFAAFSRMQIDDSKSTQSAYRFVAQVEAYLSADTQLYINSNKLLYYYYYSSETPEIRSLENWQSSRRPGENAFFIIRMDILKNHGWQGELIIVQELDSKDKAMVLFRPAAQ